MTETSPESTEPSKDTTTVLPLLSEATAPITVSLTIDKSISKIASWAMAVIIASSVMIGAGICMSIWMISAWSRAEREARVQTQELIYLQAAVLAHGIPIPHPPGNRSAEEQKVEPPNHH